MKKDRIAKNITFLSFVLISILGTLFHFAFEYSDGSTIVGAFTPVNESIWEHLKLILFPSILSGMIEFIFYGRYYDSYLASKSLSTVFGMIFIIVGYYTYTGIIGNDYPAINIAIFLLATLLTCVMTYFLTVKNPFNFSETEAIIGISVITALIVIFIYFTFTPPHIEIFRDPISEDFGIVDALRYIQ